MYMLHVHAACFSGIVSGRYTVVLAKVRRSFSGNTCKSQQKCLQKLTEVISKISRIVTEVLAKISES
jgi:hypothetical protein